MHGIIFESLNKNKYFYDDDSGMIYPMDKDSLKYKSKLKKYDKLKKFSNRPKIIHNTNEEDIKKHLFSDGNGFRQLILEVTSQCNLRCKYCIYSEHYMYTTSYANNFMDFNTAKKSIDYYFDNFKKIKYRNPSRQPMMGFYGGEPLVNLKLIKQVVQYVKDNYPEEETLFNLTTNGLLFDDAAQKFLVENKFSILVSLDGDQFNHDRNRVDINGKGTFTRIIKNVRDFKKTYPQYVKFSISACYDYKTDILKMADFFNEEKLSVARIAQVEANNTTYYESFSEEEIQIFYEKYMQLFNRFMEQVKANKVDKESFEFSLIGVSNLEFSFHPMLNELKPDICPYTSNCIPGEKIYVTTDGNYHACEKINHNFPIGEINNGLNYTEIARLINEYKKNIYTNCSDCDVTRLCAICFSTCGNDKCFKKPQNICSSTKNMMKNKLMQLVSILENRQDLFEDITVNYYKNIFEKAGEKIE